MAMNRKQRRAMARAKKPGQSFAEAVGARQMIREAVEREVHSESVRLESDIINQRMLWEAVVALNEEFGFGGQRAVRFMEALGRVADEVLKMREADGEQYAFEKLRQRASQITGIDIKYIHEDEMREARKHNEAEGVFFPADPDL